MDEEIVCSTLSLLEEMGITPVIKEGKGKTLYFYIEKDIVWSKMLSSIKQIDEINEGIKTIPHVKWIENLILYHNPILEEIEYEGKPCWGIRFQAVIDKNGKVPHIDRCLGFIFYMVQSVLTPVITALANELE